MQFFKVQICAIIVMDKAFISHDYTTKSTANLRIPATEIRLKGNHFHRKEAKYMHLLTLD